MLINKIYLIGASGYIGSYLKKKFNQKIYKIIYLDRDFYNQQIIDNPSNAILLFLSQPSSLIYKFNSKDVTFIRKILKYNWGHIIYFSTSLFKLYPSQSKKFELPDYLKLKLLTEEKIKEFNHTILRLANVYGPKFKKNTFLNKLKKIQAKKEILNLSKKNHVRDYIHLDDVYTCLIKILEIRPIGTLYLGSGKSISTNDLIKLMKKKNKFLKKYYNLIYFKKSVDSKVLLNINKTKKILNWKPTKFIQNNI